MANRHRRIGTDDRFSRGSMNAQRLTSCRVRYDPPHPESLPVAMRRAQAECKRRVKAAGAKPELVLKLFPASQSEVPAKRSKRRAGKQTRRAGKRAKSG